MQIKGSPIVLGVPFGARSAHIMEFGPVRIEEVFGQILQRFAQIGHHRVDGASTLAMIFKLAEAAEKSWRRLNGHNQLPKIILGIKFTDGIEVVRSQAQTAAA
jgi:hypothetical protein